MSDHSKVIEEYLLTLYKIDRSGEKAKAVTLASRLETSAPTVHATISRMQRDGLVYVKKSKVVTLTKEGQKVAEDRCRREVPEWRELSQNHSVACHFAEKLVSAS